MTPLVFPADKYVTLSYDAANMTARVDSQARETDYKYDVRHRLKEVDYVGRSADDRFYSYDLLSRILSVSEPGKSGAADVAYTYDEMGRMATETSSGSTHTYGYDAAGNRTKVGYGFGTELVSTYDELNRLSTLSETTTGISGVRTTSYGYDLSGNRVFEEQASGEVVTTSFDAMGRALGSSTLTAAGSPVLSTTQGYDRVGNLVTMSERHFGADALPPRTVVNAYDSIYRLLTETSSQAAHTTVTTYVYDDANNRSSQAVAVTYHGQTTTETTVYSYNNLNQLQSITSGSTVTNYSYDDDGNRIGRTRGSETTVYSYDHGCPVKDHSLIWMPQIIKE